MTKKAKTPDTSEYQPRKTGLVSFGADVRTLLAPILGKKGFIQADILSRWDDILGPVLAGGVIPASVSFSKSAPQQAVLHVKAYSGAYAVEFTARKEQILEKINAYFGYQAIVDIRVTQGTFTPKLPRTAPVVSATPRQQQEMRRLTVDIENEALRSAVAELGLSLNTDKK